MGLNITPQIQPATATILGGVKQGNNTTISPDGKIDTIIPSLNAIPKKSITQTLNNSNSFVIATTKMNLNSYSGKFKIVAVSLSNSNTAQTIYFTVSGYKNNLPYISVESNYTGVQIINLIKVIYPKYTSGEYGIKIAFSCTDGTTKNVTAEIIESENLTFLDQFTPYIMNYAYETEFSTSTNINGIILAGGNITGNLTGNVTGYVNGSSASSRYVYNDFYESDRDSTFTPYNIVFLDKDAYWKPISYLASIPIGSVIGIVDGDWQGGSQSTAITGGITMISNNTFTDVVVGKSLYLVGDTSQTAEGIKFISTGDTTTEFTAQSSSYMRIGTLIDMQTVNLDGNNIIYTVDPNGNFSHINGIPIGTTVYKSSSAPINSFGKNGDLWIIY